MADAEQTAPKIAVKAQYVRDASFENVAVQAGDGRLDAKPEIQVGVNLDAKKRGEGTYEVVLKVNATARARASEGEAATSGASAENGSGAGGGAVMFIIELEYAGVFQVEHVPEAQLHPFLLVECPRILFPFARRIVADLTRDGGYPPLMLDMVDFAGLYRSEVERRRVAEQAAGEEDAPASDV